MVCILDMPGTAIFFPSEYGVDRNIVKMAAAAAAQSVVKAQQEYAALHNLSSIFEKLATAIVYSKPEKLLDFIANEAKKMIDQGDSYSPVPVNRVTESEESAAQYMDSSRVPAVLEELFALILVNKPNCPYNFIVSESVKLQDLYEGNKPVRIVYVYFFFFPF